MQRLLLRHSWQLQSLRCICCLHVLRQRECCICWARQACLLQLGVCLAAGCITCSCIVQQYVLHFVQHILQLLNQACLLQVPASRA